MPIRASSLVLRTSRTFNVVSPSGRTVCQSLPPSKTSPESLSPSNEPPGTTPIRRYPPGVAPTICSFLTFKRITNNGWVLSVLRASGRLSLRSVNMMLGWGLVMSFSLKLLRSKSGLAAIDSDDLTGEVVHLVRGEKHDRLSDLLSRSSAFHRHAGDQAGFSVGIARKAVQHFGLNRARRDRVDAHARSCTFERGRFRQAFDRVLAGNVHRRARRAAAAKRRR